jgi:hypothetical protein
MTLKGSMVSNLDMQARPRTVGWFEFNAVNQGEDD